MSGKIVISSIGSVSALGSDSTTILDSIELGLCRLELKKLNSTYYPVMPVHETSMIELTKRYP